MEFYKVRIIDDLQEEYSVEFYKWEYINLMELIRDRLYIDFGDCKGRAMCGTCQVVLEVGNQQITEAGIYELETLKKQANVTATSRLACQILVDKYLHGKVFKVVTES